MYKLEVKKTVDKDGIVTYTSYAFVGNNDEEKKQIYFNELKRIMNIDYFIVDDSDYEHADSVISMLRSIDDFGYSTNGIIVDMWCGIWFKYHYRLSESEPLKPKIKVEFYGILDALVDAYNILQHINDGDIDNYIIE